MNINTFYSLTFFLLAFFIIGKFYNFDSNNNVNNDLLTKLITKDKNAAKIPNIYRPTTIHPRANNLNPPKTNPPLTHHLLLPSTLLIHPSQSPFL